MSEKKKRPRLRHFLLCVAELVLLVGPLLGVLIANPKFSINSDCPELGV